MLVNFIPSLHQLCKRADYANFFLVANRARYYDTKEENGYSKVHYNEG
jgi:hypothetical protein